MIELYKKRGETPLQALDRLRTEDLSLQSETLSYAGRLDPMAEGILPILVGEEENKNRQEYLNKNKEYYAEFVLGMSTDTGDILGIVQYVDNAKIDMEKIHAVFENLIQITKQTYPWYSSKTVSGKALFEYAREKNFDIERPQRDVSIYEVKDIQVREENLNDVVNQYIKDIQGVVGDFRQEEIVESWENVNCHPNLQNCHPDLQNCHPGFIPGSSNIKSETPKQVRGDKCSEASKQVRDDKYIVQGNDVQIVSCTLSVSSGTYIRGLCEVLEKELGVPVTLQKLVRSKVF